jgi:hypothetical protein
MMSDGIRAKVRAAVTDTGVRRRTNMSGGRENLFGLLRACGSQDDAGAPLA